MSQLTRLPDWPERLAAFLAAVKDRRFAWANHDCCSFAADAVLAMTGTDAIAPWRGTYTTKLQAARVLGKAGGLSALVTSCVGQPLASPLLAQRGDVMLFEMPAPHGPAALGICVGPHIAAPGPRGTELLPCAAALAAWRI